MFQGWRARLQILLCGVRFPGPLPIVEIDMAKKRSQTRGITKHPLYKTWVSMKMRCNNPNTINYEYYGKRGISVCDRWNDSFECFILDMGTKQKGMTLDRIDNNKGYYKENCKWSTQKEQIANRRTRRTYKSVRMISPNGDRVIVKPGKISEFCSIEKLSRHDVYRVLSKNKPMYKGWKAIYI